MGMDTLTSETAATPKVLPDEEIVRRIRAGDSAAFEILMRRHNQRVYRVVRAVVKDEADVEDVMQQAYINAFTHLHQFEDRSQFSTWLIRIALHEAIRPAAQNATSRNHNGAEPFRGRRPLWRVHGYPHLTGSGP